MFSGIVESQKPLVDCWKQADVLRVSIEKPKEFNDLSVGDSIAVNGVCLTLEDFDRDQMSFALAAETLQLTQWTAQELKGQIVNLERSLGLGSRIHGHLVLGHVDAMGRVVEKNFMAESGFLDIELPGYLAHYVWKKGSVALNGVSLTINQVAKAPQNDRIVLSLCLIPETLKRTNLGLLELGNLITVEVDNMARGLIQWLESQEFPHTSKGASL